jgi:hypothetical protein
VSAEGARNFVTSLIGIVGFASAALALSRGASASTFPTGPEAKRHRPADVVVWLNTENGIFYYRDQRWYGNTKGGAFACRNEIGPAGPSKRG